MIRKEATQHSNILYTTTTLHTKIYNQYMHTKGNAEEF